MSLTWIDTMDLDGAAEKATGGAADGLFLAVQNVLQVSRTHVPIEEGTLERSGVASVDRDNLIGAVAYDTVYAVPQHEELDYQHDAGRTAKYLENAFNSERGTSLKLIGDNVTAELGD